MYKCVHMYNMCCNMALQCFEFQNIKNSKFLVSPSLIIIIINFVFFFSRQAVIIALLVKLNVIKQSEALNKYGFEDVAVSMQVSHHMTITMGFSAY